ncbi:MAG: cyclic nucleotide-binding domain-containing protein [Deltaproteobacteria bacterium]|nr:cyclic nucleotide-binding domain-containing protein [Deltaproteobacteria bacterium]MBW2071061.1 cyclic nucleotide-binding domain-containing protein [Deltaproteobacteria bacterium]
MKRYYLTLEKGPLHKSIYPLEGPVTIGRSPENTITLADHKVSRSHARISFQESGWVVEDLGSINGVLFAGKRVARRTLKAGDTFSIGDAVFSLIEQQVPSGSEQLTNTLEIFAATGQYETLPPASEGRSPEPQRFRDVLMATPLFAPLEQSEQDQLLEEANLHVFHSGELIMREGDPGRSLYVILRGRAKVFVTDLQGKQLQVAMLGPKEFFGEMAFLTGGPRMTSVMAVQETLLSEFSYTRLRKFILRYRQLKEMLVKYYQERLEDLNVKRAVAGIKERRRYPRLREQLPVALFVTSEEGKQATQIDVAFDATSIDISLTGMLIQAKGGELEKTLVLDSPVTLEINLPAPWGGILAPGVVRWLKPEADTWQVGIEFSQLPEIAARKLKDFIYG